MAVESMNDEIAYLRDELIEALAELNAIRLALNLSRDRDAADVRTQVQQIMSGVAARERKLIAGFVAAEQERDAAVAERDRLRRELEALRDSLTHGPAPHRAPKGWVVDRLDAILRGEDPSELHPEDFAAVSKMVAEPPEPTPQLVEILKEPSK